jgi:hypothetical protein
LVSDNVKIKDLPELPEHLKRWSGLFVRNGDRVIEALPNDITVAKNYPYFQEKGPINDGKRITILSENATIQTGAELRIIHVVEFTEPGHRAYIGGPKSVYGEFINDKLMTERVPTGDPLVPTEYSGVTLPSPAVDYNYDITSYAFNVPGIYHIQWRLGLLNSNTLVVTVKPFRI